MKYFRNTLCLLLSLLCVLFMSSCAAQRKMGELQPAPVGLSAPQQHERDKIQGDIYVSPQGDYQNSGTKQSPVQSIGRALELAALSSDFENTDDSAFAANPAGSTVEYNVIVNEKKTLGDAGDYGADISVKGFEPLPVSQMGRTYQ